MRIYDLANPLRKHWNWAGDGYRPHAYDGRLPESIIVYPKHGFTHVDAPCHMVRGSKTTDDCALSQLCGEAAVIDVSDCVPAKPVTAELLEARGQDVRRGDIVILRSNLANQFPNTSADYWINSPYVDPSGARWLVERGLSALVVDFPQDYPAREMGDRHVANEEWTEHLIVLGGGLMHLEHVRGLDAIKERRVFLFGWPIKIPSCDGGPARPVALAEWPKGTPKVVDMSIALDEGWRNTVRVMRSKTFEVGDPVQETGFSWLGHSHTHVVTPSYVTSAQSDGLDAIDGERLAAVCNWVHVADLRAAASSGVIARASLEPAVAGAATAQILLLYTGHADRIAYGSPDWLKHSPALSVDAADWLIAQGFKTIALDFELEAGARASNEGLLTEAQLPVESRLLRSGIRLIKNVCGAGELLGRRAFMAAAPLRVPRAESAPARAMAVFWE
jgi:arylformamidase